jgi:hypothetical protein
MSKQIETRKEALQWWATLSKEHKWLQIVKNKENIFGYPDRAPDTLTGREIELMYIYKNR